MEEDKKRQRENDDETTAEKTATAAVTESTEESKANQTQRNEGFVNQRIRRETNEGDLGIQTFMSLCMAAQSSAVPPVRFGGVLKLLYSDFVVREVPEIDGQPESEMTPLRLNRLDVPEDCRDPPKVDGGEGAGSADAARDALKASGLLTDVDITALVELAFPPKTEENGDDDGVKKTTAPSAPIQLASFPDKEQRKAVHALVRSTLGKNFESAAAENQCIEVRRVLTQRQAKQEFQDIKKAAGGKKNKKGKFVGPKGTFTYRGDITKPKWPQGRGEYLHFTLYKENIDSHHALRLISARVNQHANKFTIAGTKDKRAVTAQRVACRYLSAETLVNRITNVTHGIAGRHAKVMVGDFAYMPRPLQLGCLKGNHFTVVLRGIHSLDGQDAASRPLPEELKKQLTATTAYLSTCIGDNGFINYFGPQRFGTTSIKTFDVGVALLQKDFKKAVELVLKSKVDMEPQFQAVIDAYNSPPTEHPHSHYPNYAKALSLVPRFCHAEKDILKALVDQPGNYEQALVHGLPRTLLMLYFHSLQSLIWNFIASRRLQIAPHVLVGDLVYASSSSSSTSSGSSNGAENKENVDAEAETEDNDAATKEDDDNRTNNNNTDDGGENDDGFINKNDHSNIRHVTQEDIDQGKYTLADVLLPLPGLDKELVFPRSEPNSWSVYADVCANQVGVDASKILPAAPTNNNDGESVNNSSSSNDDVRKMNAGSRGFAAQYLKGTYRHLVVVPRNFSLRMTTYCGKKTNLLVETEGMANRGETLGAAPTTATATAASNSAANGNDSSATEAETSAAAKSNITAEADEENEEQKEKLAVILDFSLPPGSYATSLIREICDVSG